MTQFYFVLTNLEAVPIIKEEIRLRYPELKLGYSKSSFLTFKAESEILFHPLFCRLWGLCHGRFKKEELRPKKAWVYALSSDLVIPPDLKELSDHSIFKVGQMVELIIMTKEDEFWRCSYTLKSDHFQTPGEVSSITLQEVPSRAFYKIAEACEAFDLEFRPKEVVLELGAAPGGASLFLLDQNLKVLGVDPAQMDPVILKRESFKHLKKPFESLSSHDLKQEVNWIVCDINLPPTIILKEIFRLLSFTHPRGVLLTLKINDLKHLELIAGIREKFRHLGLKKVELKYLPSHRQEILLMALHS